jgi:hypothetical protein
MTYRRFPREWSGYGGGRQSFWLDYGEIAGQLQPLKNPFR